MIFNVSSTDIADCPWNENLAVKLARTRSRDTCPSPNKLNYIIQYSTIDLPQRVNPNSLIINKLIN